MKSILEANLCAYTTIHSFCCVLSLVHVRNFTPGVYFRPCEPCFKNLHPGVNLHPGAICSCLRGGANLFAPGCKLCT